MQHFDVIIIGAGLSGVGAGVHLKKRSPKRSYLILEGRAAMGGTWDIFRYPGIRSDSDMYTLGYAFKPWTEAKAIADGPSILKYVRETAAEYGVDKHIRYNHRVKRASWSTPDARWTVEAERADTNSGAKEIVTFTCSFLFSCAGYYSYETGHHPHFDGQENFKGRIVYPQFWPEDLDYAGKRVVVIGSGATAVTIVPEMAKTAAHVTMLQRSPTYMVSRPAEDKLANSMRKTIGAKASYHLIRLRNVLFQLFFFNIARKKPEKTKENLIGMVRERLGPDYDVGTHFTPCYNPWDQRLCLVPDADFFEAINAGKSSVVTDNIDSFTEGGIKLKSGQEIPADVIVSATGLKLNFLGDVQLTIDGTAFESGKATVYKGMMFSGAPNLASTFGYTNASWTLKADLTCEYVCRLLNHMERTGTLIATPVLEGAGGETPFLDFSSGYVRRAIEMLPKQGAAKPWKLNHNYIVDLLALRHGRVEDGVMRFTNPAPAAREAAPTSRETIKSAA